MRHFALLFAVALSACAEGALAGLDGGAIDLSGDLPCGAPGAEIGRCEGTWLAFCFEGELRRLDCTLVDAMCGFDPMEGINRCVPPGTGQPPREPPLSPATEPDDPPAQPPSEPPAQPPTEAPGDPPADVCDGVPDGRRCDGDTVIICRNEEAAGRTNCRANGLTCTRLPDGTDGCAASEGGELVPEGPEDLPQEGLCGGVAIGSRCQGNFVVSCRNGVEESRFDCAGEGQTCSQFDDQWAGCEGQNNNNPPPEQPGPEPAGCGNVPFWGQCSGDIFEVCNLFEDEVVTIDCRALGATCGQSPEGLIGCLWQ